MSLFIVGISEENLKAFRDVGFNTLEIDVKDILVQKRNGLKKYKEPFYFVSPANSLGYMDGGIDKTYMGMFNNIERKVKEGIKTLVPKFNNISKLGRPYLPIGSAIKIEVENNNYLISAPTMLQPQSVKNTKNAYWATKASLHVWCSRGTIFIPMMCCGYGKMDLKEAAKQMKQAYDEYEKMIYDIIQSGTDVPNIDYYIQEPNMDEQPNYYENTEFKEISFDKIEQK